MQRLRESWELAVAGGCEEASHSCVCTQHVSIRHTDASTFLALGAPATPSHGSVITAGPAKPAAVDWRYQCLLQTTSFESGKKAIHTTVDYDFLRVLLLVF